MVFPETEVHALLARCHRRCCICHKFCGVKMEIDHVVQRADGGPDTIDNAIPVCLECHAEIHLYNDRHPKGRKFSPQEIRMHRDQWLSICDTHPEVLLDPPRSPNPGMLERLIHALEFNKAIVALSAGQFGCPFETDAFRQAIADGTLSWLTDEVRHGIQAAYIAMQTTNTYLDLAKRKTDWNLQQTWRGEAEKTRNQAGALLDQVLGLIARSFTASPISI